MVEEGPLRQGRAVWIEATMLPLVAEVLKCDVSGTLDGVDEPDVAVEEGACHCFPILMQM